MGNFDNTVIFVYDNGKALQIELRGPDTERELKSFIHRRRFVSGNAVIPLNDVIAIVRGADGFGMNE